MTSEQALNILELLGANEGRDYESDHINADQVLMDFLSSLGYDDIVAAYDKVGKWYA